MPRLPHTVAARGYRTHLFYLPYLGFHSPYCGSATHTYRLRLCGWLDCATFTCSCGLRVRTTYRPRLRGYVTFTTCTLRFLRIRLPVALPPFMVGCCWLLLFTWTVAHGLWFTVPFCGYTRCWLVTPLHVYRPGCLLRWFTDTLHFGSRYCPPCRVLHLHVLTFYVHGCHITTFTVTRYTRSDSVIAGSFTCRCGWFATHVLAFTGCARYYVYTAPFPVVTGSAHTAPLLHGSPLVPTHTHHHTHTRTGCYRSRSRFWLHVPHTRYGCVLRTVIHYVYVTTVTFTLVTFGSATFTVPAPHLHRSRAVYTIRCSYRVTAFCRFAVAVVRFGYLPHAHHAIWLRGSLHRSVVDSAGSGYYTYGYGYALHIRSYVLHTCLFGSRCRSGLRLLLPVLLLPFCGSTVGSTAFYAVLRLLVVGWLLRCYIYPHYALLRLLHTAAPLRCRFLPVPAFTGCLPAIPHTHLCSCGYFHTLPVLQLRWLGYTVAVLYIAVTIGSAPTLQRYGWLHGCTRLRTPHWLPLLQFTAAWLPFTGCHTCAPVPHIPVAFRALRLHSSAFCTVVATRLLITVPHLLPTPTTPRFYTLLPVRLRLVVHTTHVRLCYARLPHRYTTRTRGCLCIALHRTFTLDTFCYTFTFTRSTVGYTFYVLRYSSAYRLRYHLLRLVGLQFYTPSPATFWFFAHGYAPRYLHAVAVAFCGYAHVRRFARHRYVYDITPPYARY